MIPENTTPLRIIREWWEAQPELVKGSLTFFILLRAKGFDPIFETDETLSKWLKERLDCFQHVGRALFARSLIDYAMTQQTNDRFWENAIEVNLDIVDSGLHAKGLRNFINENLGRLPDAKATWLAAGNSWREVRDSFLEDVPLHHWEHQMLCKFHGQGLPGIGDGE